MIWQPRGTAHSQRRVAGLVRALVGGLVAVLLAALGHFRAGLLVGALASLGVLLWALAPPLQARLDAALEGAGRGVAVVIAWLLLAPFFFLVMTPLGLATRRRDRLGLRVDRSRASYWRARPPADPRDIERPY